MMKLQAWISEWQKGKIDAKETWMQIRASKSIAFPNRAQHMRAHSGLKQPNSGPISYQPEAVEQG